MKKYIVGVMAMVFAMGAMVVPNTTQAASCEAGYRQNSEGVCVRILGGATNFHFPSVQDRLYNYGPYLGFLGNKNAVGHLFIGKKSVDFARTVYGTAHPTVVFDPMPRYVINPLAEYDYKLSDEGATYHAFEKPAHLKGKYYVRGCFESVFGLSCGDEFEINL